MNSKYIRIVYGKEDREINLGLVTYLITTGMFVLFLIMPVFKWIYFGGAIVLTLVFGILLKILEKKSGIRLWLVSACVTAAASAAALIFSSHFVSGSIVYLNGMIDCWNKKTEGINHLFLAESRNEQLDLIIFLVLIILVLDCWIETLLFYNRSLVVLVLSFFSFIFYVFVSDRMLITGIIWMGVSTVVIIAGSGSRIKRIDRTLTYYCIIAVMVLFVSLGVVLSVKLVPQEHIQNWHQAIVRLIEKEAYGETDLTDGNLVGIGAKKNTGTERLNVSGNGIEVVYLRGYVGSRYTGNAWTDLAGEAYSGNNLNMHRWMMDIGMSPLMSLAQSLTLLNGYQQGNSSVREASYRVENIGAQRKYLYMPYGIANMTFEYYDNINKDLNVKNDLLNQFNDYKMDTMELPFYEYEDLANNGVLTDTDIIAVNQTFFSAEQTYRDFSIQYYTEISDELKAYFDTELSDISAGGSKGVTTAIRNFLNGNIRYSEEPRSTYDGSKDFIINLLTSDKEGYSVHYATVAVMLFRYYGIPARYVEGYARLGGADLLTDADAHAWVEIYRYGFGWVPVEVTPGYYEAVNDRIAGSTDSSVSTYVGKIPESPQTEGLDDEDPQSRLFEWLVISGIALIVLMLLFIVTVLIRRKIILRRKRKNITEGSMDSKVRYLAKYLRTAAAKQGVHISEGFSADSNEKMDALFLEVTGLSFNYIRELIFRSQFSKEGAGQLDEDDIKDYFNLVVEKVFALSNRFKKLVLKYFLVID